MTKIANSQANTAQKHKSLDLSIQQKELASAIKNPTIESIFESRRLKIYQELIFNNIEGFCSTAFPVFKSLIADNVWVTLVRQFLVSGEKHSPYFVDIAEQFLVFLTENNEQNPLLPSHLIELAHYEWIELHISVQEPPKQVEEWNRDARYSVPDSAWALAYQYPVHRFGSQGFMAEDLKNGIEPNPTFLIVYLDSFNTVGFIQTNALAVQVLAFIEEAGPSNYTNLLDFLTTTDIGLTNEQASNFLNQAFEEFVSKGVLIAE